MNGKTVPEGTEPLQISFARSQSQPPLEWILQTSLMQSYQTVPTIPMNPMNPIGVSVVRSKILLSVVLSTQWVEPIRVKVCRVAHRP
jgi:hypothetical protein